MTNTNSIEAGRAFIREMVAIAAEEGQRERERMGRDMTEAEAERIVEMIMRQAKSAAAIVG